MVSDFAKPRADKARQFEIVAIHVAHFDKMESFDSAVIVCGPSSASRSTHMPTRKCKPSSPLRQKEHLDLRLFCPPLFADEYVDFLAQPERQCH